MTNFGASACNRVTSDACGVHSMNQHVRSLRHHRVSSQPERSASKFRGIAQNCFLFSVGAYVVT